jgi:hypothetical protein
LSRRGVDGRAIRDVGGCERHPDIKGNYLRQKETTDLAGVEQQEGYEHFAKTERAFLDTAADDIKALYLAAKKGNKEAGHQLTAIMLGNEPADGRNERQEQADKALALLLWWSRSS